MRSCHAETDIAAGRQHISVRACNGRAQTPLVAKPAEGPRHSAGQKNTGIVESIVYTSTSDI
jgi:hypothetical protein